MKIHPEENSIIFEVTFHAISMAAKLKSCISNLEQYTLNLCIIKDINWLFLFVVSLLNYSQWTGLPECFEMGCRMVFFFLKCAF